MANNNSDLEHFFSFEQRLNRSPFYNEKHREFARTVSDFVEKEIKPFVDEWDEKQGFPRELHKKAVRAGFYNINYPEEYGAKVPKQHDIFYSILLSQELARCGSGGLCAALMTHGIGLPPILFLGSKELKERVAPGVISGDKLICLAITEPSAGSDVANIKTTARREGDHYVVNGEKLLITSGVRADYYTVAVRTGGGGMKGISLLLIEKGMPGFTVRGPLQKMGWWAADAGQLTFHNVRVPVANLIGNENEGFFGIMLNFNGERLGMAAQATSFAALCVEEAIRRARARGVFSKRLADYQVIRHKIAEMIRQVNASQAYLEQTAWQIQRGESPVMDICLLKVQSTLTMEYCAREAMQIFGGAGFLREGDGRTVERMYREVRVMAIGGGSEEIMRDLAMKQARL